MVPFSPFAPEAHKTFGAVIHVSSTDCNFVVSRLVVQGEEIFQTIQK